MTYNQTPSPDLAGEFKREERFIVVKRKHLTSDQSEALLDTINREGIATSECVVVESDWPEYETVWAMIEARCTGQALRTTQADNVLREALEGYRAACSWIAADSWDGCSECMMMLRKARTADWEWQWTPDEAAKALQRLRERADGIKREGFVPAALKAPTTDRMQTPGSQPLRGECKDCGSRAVVVFASPTTEPNPDAVQVGERVKPKVHSIRAVEGSTEFHAQKDLEYIEGLQAHCDEGGKVSPKNVSDLIAMVRWNAETLLSTLSTTPEQSQ